MKNNFEKSKGGIIKKAVLVGSVALAAATAHNEANSQTLNDTIKISTEQMFDTDTLLAQSNDRDIRKEIDNLRIQKIAELKGDIKDIKSEIELNSNPKKFKELKKGTLSSTKEQLEQNFQEWQSINLDLLTEEEVALLIDYISQHERDLDIPENEREKLGETGFFGFWESYKQSEIKEKFYKNKKVFRFYTEYISDWMFGYWLNKKFQIAVDSLDINMVPKEKFNEAIKKIIDSIKSENICFKNENDIENFIENEWSNRESVEDLNNKTEEYKKEIKLISKNLNLDDVSRLINSSRAWLLNNISSDAYLNKLIKGEGLSVEEARKTQIERFERVKNIPSTIDSDYSSFSQYFPTELGYSKDSVAFNAYDVARSPTNPLHEFEHSNTRAIYNMSEQAKNLYTESLLSDEEIQKIIENNPETFSNINLLYWKNTSELDARKKVLENEMEKLEIKKYGEIMTHEHYLKLQEFLKAGKLDHNSVQILLITTEDGLLKTINDIAFNQNFKQDKNGSARYSGWDYDDQNNQA